MVNFLPIPIVDGGLFTLLILEKVQGKPLSPDAQRIVQMVGLVLILGVFLLVTYQDIAQDGGILIPPVWIRFDPLSLAGPSPRAATVNTNNCDG